MNKIIVSIVFAVILVLIINKITNAIYHVEKPEKSAYQVASMTTDAGTKTIETSSESSESGNIITLFASTIFLSLPISVLLNFIPKFASAGFKQRLTLTPPCKPTPLSSISSAIVFCRLNIIINGIQKGKNS